MKSQDRLTDARHADAFRDLKQAVELEQAGLLAQAETAYARVIEKNPKYFDALHLYGLFKFKSGQLSDAVRLVEKAHKINPGSLNALNSLGVVYAHLKNYSRALDAFNKIIHRNKDDIQALSNKAQCLNELGRFQEAVDICNKVLSLDKLKLDAYLARGAALLELSAPEQALSSYQTLVAFNQRHELGWCGIGNALYRLRRYNEALAAYDRALSIKADCENAWLGRGNVFFDLKRYEEALAAYDKALSIRSDLENAWLGRGNILSDLKRYDEAFAAFDRALRLDGDLKYAQSLRLHAKMHLCDWANIEVDISQLLSDLRKRKPLVPFVLLTIPSSPMQQLQCAKSFIAGQTSLPAPLWRGETYSHDRIRVAYLSNDFAEHATSYLIAGLFELHDKERFQVTALSIGPPQNSPMRQKIADAVECFVDVRDKTDQQIAELIRQLEIDIAIDLNGLTSGGRSSVFSWRAAPLQVNYLGYPGTMGADFIDYVIADSTIIPQSEFSSYAERVVWLPDSYQVNDWQRRISEQGTTRHECGLPDDAFVFCCFNRSYKILPDMFDAWMRLLRARDNSVLWLAEVHPLTSANLRREAEKRGVAAERLVFAPPAPLPEHLARHRHADLFLDTLPCNAHTTASDALWAGVPVLTQIGQTFAGRVAASLLNAIGLPELITHSRGDYEALALDLALDRQKVFAIKEKLNKNRLTTPLFDTRLFARSIEAAYSAMCKRHQAGLPPDHIQIQPIATSQ